MIAAPPDTGLTATDLFCGGGGSSSGAEMAGVKLRLGLNHWARAIETHSENFQHADHDCEDVSSLTTAQIRRYPDSDILLASPECVNHSIAKGARRRKPQAASLFDDGPAGSDEQDRSRATMWDVVRFAEQKLIKGRPYKAVVVENVVDAFKWGWNDDGGLFHAWLQAMRALGYQHEIVWLNSMFCYPVPQSRDRMYVVFWRPECLKAAPDLRVEPPSWCPRCEQVVAGQQTFKKREYRWGRYGQQYYYSCPTCAPAGQAVIPGAFPASSIIDRSLPAPVIGERARPLAKNTRERIRRGLERLASEPFAIRLTHRGTPKPLTLPLSTQTGRADAAMVMPVSGNTHETTPGNRARDAAAGPLATVHGTLDRALVTRTSHKGANGVYARDGERDPMFGVTGHQDLALVYANRAHGRPRPAEEAPAQAVLGGGHLGVVVSNYSPGWARRAGDGPVGSVTTQDGHSLVVPYSTQGRTKRAGSEPCDTLTRENKLSLVVPYMRTSRATPTELEPAATIPGRDRLSLLVPAGGSWANGSTLAEREPAPTQTATESRGVVEVTDEDVDACRFRMFSIPEIARAMAMDLHPMGGAYVVLGNKRERMAQYGNGVTPPAMRLLVERIVEQVIA